MYPIYVLPSPWFPNFNPFCQPFLSYGSFWKKSAPSDPRNDLEPYKVQMYPIYVLLSNLSPKFHSVSPMTSHFRDTDHFETSTPNNPKMILNPTRSNVPHTCVTTINNPKFLSVWLSRSAVFKIHAILRQVHWMTAKWHWTLHGQMYPIYVSSVPVSNFTL